MRNTRRLSLLVLAMLLAGACGRDPAAPAGIQEDQRQQAVTAVVDGDVLVVRNDADFAVRMAVVERAFAEQALILWCFGGDDCGTRVGPRAELRLPFSQIEGYAAGRDEALVHWWNPADPDRDAGAGAPVRKFAVRLAGAE